MLNFISQREYSHELLLDTQGLDKECTNSHGQLPLVTQREGVKKSIK